MLGKLDIYEQKNEIGPLNHTHTHIQNLQKRLKKWSEVKSLSRVRLFATPWSLPGSSIQGIIKARILKWIAISFSK